MKPNKHFKLSFLESFHELEKQNQNNNNNNKNKKNTQGPLRNPSFLFDENS